MTEADMIIALQKGAENIINYYYPKAQEYKEDCFWYYEWQDMNAYIPACKKKKEELSIGPEDCENCQFYRNKNEVTNAEVFEDVFGINLKEMSLEEIYNRFAAWEIEAYKKP